MHNSCKLYLVKILPTHVVPLLDILYPPLQIHSGSSEHSPLSEHILSRFPVVVEFSAQLHVDVEVRPVARGTSGQDSRPTVSGGAIQ